ncbi:unnamed protein product [Ilex paraguariensis]|uniref:Protein kinase domain-containing protein n=1 Tax=Ilex paraguariensis TaxID=185542 RepID=A0ABC8QW49_9AQUA
MPPHIGNLSFLRELDFQNHSLVHEIPSELGRNSFRGSIPDSLGHLGNLTVIALDGSRLSGAIPPSILISLPSQEIYGEGSYGSVYKGVLEDQNGNESVVAVKVLNLSHQGASKSFLSECEALRNIGHRNLVNVVTACSGADYQGNDFKALVYEFKENTSQPNNILLNKDKVAHVGDFGLARSLLNASYSNSAQQTSSSIGLRGSIGYVAPEYGLGSEPSMPGDVYN